MARAAAPFQLLKPALGKDARLLSSRPGEPGTRNPAASGSTAAGSAGRFPARFQTEPDYPADQASAACLGNRAGIVAAETLRDEPTQAATNTPALSTLSGALKAEPTTGERIDHRLVGLEWEGAAKPIVWPASAIGR